MVGIIGKILILAGVFIGIALVITLCFIAVPYIIVSLGQEEDKNKHKH